MPTFLLECQLLYDEQYRHIRHLVLVIVIITIIIIINSLIFLIFAFIMAVSRAAGQHNTSEE